MGSARPRVTDRIPLFMPASHGIVGQDDAPAALHREALEEEATHVTDEARMILPGVQAIMGFQLIAVFNDRFHGLDEALQIVHLVAFLLVTLVMGLLMAPAAYHRLAERGRVTRCLVDLASTLLCLALVPFMVGVALDAYLIAYLMTSLTAVSLGCAGSVLLALSALWFGLPYLARTPRR
jgi:uncharacterized membrane-anchored protein